MSDIVERLRDPVNNWNSGGRFEAADEIERLRAALVRIAGHHPLTTGLHGRTADLLASAVGGAIDALNLTPPGVSIVAFNVELKGMEAAIAGPTG